MKTKSYGEYKVSLFGWDSEFNVKRRTFCVPYIAANMSAQYMFQHDNEVHDSHCVKLRSRFKCRCFGVANSKSEFESYVERECVWASLQRHGSTVGTCWGHLEWHFNYVLTTAHGI